MFSLILCGLGCLTPRRCSVINFIYVFTTQKWHVHTSFIFMLIMLWIFSTHPPFPLVHLFYSYLCRNQAISAPPAHKHNERENTMLQHSHCLSNGLQHHWERNRDLLERRSALYLPEKLQQASSAFNYVSCKPPFSLKQPVVIKKECKTWAQFAPRTQKRRRGVSGRLWAGCLPNRMCRHVFEHSVMVGCK